ncbi:MAG: helix-turn-helix domain-containing protein [Bacteroidota bacterium]|nr:helix-turn-helix domain-containing protein [Bacteroidota bacterium]
MTNDIFLKETGRKIKAARKAKKISLEKMGELTGINMSNLWFLENGRRNAHILTLKSIADVLQVDVKDLFKGKALNNLNMCG